MTNIDIQSFTTVSSVNDSDYILLARYSGTNGKIRMALLINNMVAKISPTITADGYWRIGGVDTGVRAEGRTPQMALVDGNISVRYSDAEAWQAIVSIEELRLDFDMLTPEQIAQLKMTYDDLSEADKAELMKPAMEAAQRADDATEASEKQTKLCKAATDDANDTALHPTYIGQDNYVYTWNKTTRTYDKTDIYVRGEAFHISKVFPSVAAMEAYQGADIAEGDFVLIDTGDVENPDNAKLYVKNATGWGFLVDMSGAIGFTGRTPQFSIGTVTAGEPNSGAHATLTEDGVDSDNNPKYKLNLVIPKGDTFTYSDLTPDNIAELQRPANDMISRLEDTDDAVKEAERLRVLAENQRVTDENTRKSNETARQSEETARASAEAKRVQTENERAQAEDERADDEAARKLAETGRVNAEDARVKAEASRVSAEVLREQAERLRQDNTSNAIDDAEEATAGANAATEIISRYPPKVVGGTWHVYSIADSAYIDTGSSALGKSPYISNVETWMVYNDMTGVYEDTHVAVNSTYELTKEKVESVLTGEIATHTHYGQQYRAQVYDTLPDLDALTEYTDGQGTHPFLPGNDIYVLNSDEPTGYANYKLAVTVTGNKWVRIPQIAEGWKIVLVRNSAAQ